MDDARFARKYVNPLGETRWQPTLPNGMRAWVPTVRMYPWDIDWRTEDDTHPIITRGPRLYRSRARAARVAKRRWVKLTENHMGRDQRTPMTGPIYPTQPFAAFTTYPGCGTTGCFTWEQPPVAPCDHPDCPPWPSLDY